ncbi:MAG TPA: NUDIX domain-containing protein [Phenylobacterium sp.]|nr:NUDIX domain-containing protein [Phenylobacterium sp.]
MRERITVRVLLFDPDGRILLMKGRLPDRRDAPGAWFTVGGGAEPGETLEACALREVAEETGFTEIELGPVVWSRESVGTLVTGETVVLKETYVVARCGGAEPVRDGWEDYEHDLVDDIRWWTLEDLAACVEPIYPERFLELLPDVAAGRFPDEPLEITVIRPL